MTDTQESLHFLDYWRVIRSRKEVVISVFLLVVVTGIVVTYAMPEVFMSACVIQVKEGQPQLSIWQQQGERYDPLFLRTQFELIQSAPVIEEVVRRRELDRKFGRAYGFDQLPPDRAFQRAVRILTSSLKVQQYRDTNLIQIRIYLAEPKDSVTQEAALTANSVFEVYKELSTARSRRTSEMQLKAMENLLDERRKAVVEARDKVETIRREKKINYFNTAMRGGGSMEKRSVALLDEARIAARAKQAERKARYDRIASLTPEELRSVAPLLGNDAGLLALLTAKRQAEVEKSRMEQASLGPKHPDLLAVQAVIEELTVKMDEAAKALKTSVLAEYESAKAQVDDLDAMVTEFKDRERLAEGAEYQEFDKASDDLDHAKRICDALETRYLQERMEQNVPRTTVNLVEPAKPPAPENPVSPRFALNIMLSILVGLCSGIGLAYFVEYVNTSVKTVDDVERFMKVSVLGVIPQKVRAFVDRGAEGAHAEAYRMLRASIQFSDKWKQGKTLCITSGSVAEGKSLTVFNLGFVCAQLGDRVLIVDSDLHRPRQHKILGVSNRTGLANVLVGELTLDNAILKTQVPNLSFLPSGRLASGVHGILDTRRMRELVKDVKERFDLILFDAPPVIGVSDASLLVREVDGVLQVIQHRKYPRSVSSRAKDMIENVGGNLLGVVMNNINVSRDYSYYYRYHYYYYPKGGKDAGKESGKDAAQPPAAKA